MGDSGRTIHGFDTSIVGAHSDGRFRGSPLGNGSYRKGKEDGMSDMPHQQNLRRGRYSQPFGLYSITKCTKQGTVLSEDQRGAVVEAMQILRERGWLLLQAFAVMTDHWHALFSLADKKPLSTVVREICRLAGSIAKAKNESIPWQKGYHDHKVRPNESIVDLMKYMENNPVAVGLVPGPSGYQWSSAHESNRDRLDRSFLGHERWAEKR